MIHLNCLNLARTIRFRPCLDNSATRQTTETQRFQQLTNSLSLRISRALAH